MKDASEFKNAVDRGVYLAAAVPMRDLPPLALEYAKDLCRRVGGCGEVFISAYAAYAQMVEGLPCDDALYQVPESERAWWAERGYPKAAIAAAEGR